MVALNEDFRKMPGTNGFGGGVDVEFEFCLASRDPNGNPTNGIVRVDGSSVSQYAAEGISVGQGDGADEVSVKNLSRWDRNSYYNIWIVNEIEDNDGGAGIQGFAYFPASNATKDGAVILYNAFGTVGVLKSYTALNRTTTHEVGHAFYLYHTFQGSSCNESNCSSQGDRVCDTPPTTSNSSCNSPACSGTQQVENYMDYTSQTCMDMFTQGQKDRMHANLNLFRPNLLNSLGCVAPNARDAAITDISDPQTYSCAASISPTVTLKNFGSSTLTSVDIKYTIDNGTVNTFTWTGSLPSAGQVDVTLPSVGSSTGTHTLDVYSESPNGQADQFPSNDLATTNFEVVSGNVVNVSIQVDNFGTHTTWEVTSTNGNVVAQGGPYPSGVNGTVFTQDICLPLACYDFTIYDSGGNGIWGGAGFGNYTVTDQDGNQLATGGNFGASEATSFCLTASSNPPTANFSANNTSGCAASNFNFSDQSSGSPTSWAWTFQGGSPATSSNQNPSGVSFSSTGPHTVSLTVSSANGSDTETKTNYIQIGGGPSLTGQVQEISCAAAADGSINLSVSGGSTPYQYAWSNGAQVQDIMGLAAGTYSVTVTDAAGCSSNQSFTVTAPAAMSLNTSATPSSCGADGTASVSVSGGNSPYTYAWSNGQTGSTANQLSSGSYSVVVTDSNGCQATATVQVSSTGSVSIASTDSSPASCGGEGTASVTATGGQTPYSYSWSDAQNQSSQTANGLAAGSYTVTVTDANGCQATATVQVSSTGSVSIANTDSSPASCGGEGTATVTATGGQTPYSYSWSDAQNQSSQTANGLAAGSYTVTVTDANGCQAIATVQVSSTGSVSIASTDSSPASCGGGGTASVTATGGQTPYSYSWSDAQSQSGQTATGLISGTYSVTVTDANGCVASATVSVGESAEIDLSNSSSSPASCQNDGTATVNPSGGSSPYTYLWNDSQMQTTATATNLAAGNYNVVVTDSEGCQKQKSVTVQGQAPMNLNSTSSTASSCLNNGSAAIFPSGGTSPYTFLWSDAQMQTTATANSLASGAYTVVVTDANGCQGSATVLVDEIPGIDLSNANGSPASCTNNGTCGVTPSGGTPPYSYQWDDANQSVTSQLTNLSAGAYTVVVTDANGCSASRVINIGGTAPIDLSNASSTSSSCVNDGTATVFPSGGTPPYTYQWNDPQGQTTATASNLSGGDYLVTVTDANGCDESRIVLVQSNSSLQLSNCTATQVSCNAGSDGTAVVYPEGGQQPYSYQWNDANAQTGQQAVGLESGVYAVVVTDASGCQSMKSIAVLEPQMIHINFSMVDPLCHGESNGSIAATIDGGNGQFNYNWVGPNTGNGTLELTGVPAGEYQLNVTDVNGCQASGFVLLDQPDVLEAQVVEASPDSCGLNVGKVSLGVSGGLGQHSVQWDDDGQQIGVNLTHVRFGEYTATISDMNECTMLKTVVVEDLECSTVSSLVENELDIDFNLFPNPNSGIELKIEFSGDLTSNTEIHIIDMTGKVLQKEMVDAYSTQLSLSLNRGYTNGIYFVQMHSGGYVLTKRLTIYR